MNRQQIEGRARRVITREDDPTRVVAHDVLTLLTLMDKAEEVLKLLAEMANRLDNWEGGPPTPLHAFREELYMARAYYELKEKIE